MGKQLDLFDNHQATPPRLLLQRNEIQIGGPLRAGALVPFPTDRQTAFVRMIARAIHGRTPRLGQKYLQVALSRLIGRLVVQGFQGDVIQDELVKFANAVNHELARLSSVPVSAELNRRNKSQPASGAHADITVQIPSFSRTADAPVQSSHALETGPNRRSSLARKGPSGAA